MLKLSIDKIFFFVEKTQSRDHEHEVKANRMNAEKMMMVRKSLSLKQTFHALTEKEGTKCTEKHLKSEESVDASNLLKSLMFASNSCGRLC